MSNHSLLLRKELRLRKFEKREMKRITAPNRDAVTGNFITRSVTICTPRQKLFG
jgi:hypothetical protein